jgi:hypothetical protein
MKSAKACSLCFTMMEYMTTGRQVEWVSQIQSAWISMQAVL